MQGSLPAPDAFWERVERGEPDECWPWQGGTVGTKGYGRTRTQEGRPEYAHRIAYALTHGEIPKGAHVHHDCENRLCCNPAHLRALSPAEHARLHPNVTGPVKARSGYRNVKQATLGEAWEAEVRDRGRRVWLGSYPTAEFAALVVECFRKYRGLPT